MDSYEIGDDVNKNLTASDSPAAESCLPPLRDGKTEWLFNSECLQNCKTCATLSSYSSKNDLADVNYVVEADDNNYEEIDDDEGVNNDDDKMTKKPANSSKSSGELLAAAAEEKEEKGKNEEKEEDVLFHQSCVEQTPRVVEITKKNESQHDRKKKQPQPPQVPLIMKEKKEKTKQKKREEEIVVKPHSFISSKKSRPTVFPSIHKTPKENCGVVVKPSSSPSPSPSSSSFLLQNSPQEGGQQQCCKRLTYPTLEKEKQHQSTHKSESVTHKTWQNDVFVKYLTDVYVRPFGQTRRRQLSRYVLVEKAKKKKKLRGEKNNNYYYYYKMIKKKRAVNEAAQLREYIIEEAAQLCGQQPLDTQLTCPTEDNCEERTKWVPFSRGVSHLSTMSSVNPHFLQNFSPSRLQEHVTVPNLLIQRQQCELRRCVHELLNLCEKSSNKVNGEEEDGRGLGFSYSCVIAGRHGHRQTRLPGVVGQNPRTIPQQQKNIEKEHVCDGKDSNFEELRDTQVFSPTDDL